MRSTYIAGPMRGYPRFNFAAFDRARDRLTQEGWDVISPADLDREVYGPGVEVGHVEVDAKFVEECMRRDLLAITGDDMRRGVDAIHLLPGWETSTGANLERSVGEALGLELVELPRSAFADLPGYTAWARTEAPAGVPVTSGEWRVIDSDTGGAKGAKESQLSMAPAGALLELGKVYEFGARKYERHNYRRGYAWSLSADAALRHLLAWIDGQDDDVESGHSHLLHLAWHGLALWQMDADGVGTDDRYRRAAIPAQVDDGNGR